MFTLSKLILGASASASSGSASSFLIPWLSGNESVVYRKGTSNKDTYNFEKLDKVSEKKLQELEEIFNKLDNI